MDNAENIAILCHEIRYIEGITGPREFLLIKRQLLLLEERRKGRRDCSLFISTNIWRPSYLRLEYFSNEDAKTQRQFRAYESSTSPTK